MAEKKFQDYDDFGVAPDAADFLLVRDVSDTTDSPDGTLKEATVTQLKTAVAPTLSAASRLLGRGDSGSGAAQEITLGSGLSMNGTELSASGAGLPADDTTALVQDPADNTKRGRIDVGAVAPATTRAIIMGNRDVDLGAGGTFAEVSHVHGAADITSGTFADARIAQSNVTQHQAILSIALSQITGRGALAALNTVGTAEIDAGAVTEDQLSANAVTGASIAADAVDSQHIAAGALDTEHYAADSVGPDALAHTAVTPGEYTLATVTVDQQGRITAASNGTGTDASGSRVPTTSGALTVTQADHEVTKGVTLTTDQASAVFTIDKTTPAGAIFKFGPLHDGATAVIADDAGSIDGASGGTARLINGGVAFLEVISNAGSAPVCVTYGSVIHAPIEVSGTKTYDVNDSDQEFVLVTGAGTQTFPAVAGLPAGWRVHITNESGGNITLDGADNDVTLGDGRSALVKKAHTALIAEGSFTGGVTTMDAA